MSGPRTPHVGRLQPVFEGIPPGVDLVRDVSAADWIVSSLRPWDRDYVRLWSFMPEGFEAYARVFHPLLFGEHSSDNFQRSWREVGAEHGVELTPDVSLSEVLGVSEDDRGDVYVRPAGHPADGELPKEICRVLVDVLAPHTATPDTCWFGLWSGSGAFTTGTPLYAPPGPPRKERRALMRKQREERTYLDAIPKVELEKGRDQVLFRGPLRAACAFEPAGFVSPSMWWPDDHAWTVVTEIDGVCTYVGGSRGTIQDVLNSDLEAIEVTLDAPIS